MTRKRHRLHALVRQAQSFGDAPSDEWVDPRTRQVLFEEIVRTPVEEVPVGSPRRRRVAAVGATAVAAVMAVIAVGVAVSGTGRHQSPRVAATTHGNGTSTSPAPRGEVSGPTTSCVEKYGAATLARRAFAFDGTVTAIGTATNDIGYVPVTFAVHRWYRGGDGARVTVGMLPPAAAATPDHPTYRTGSRLLVSGEPRYGGGALDDPVAWACGFTRWYTDADAHSWQEAFRQPVR